MEILSGLPEYVAGVIKHWVGWVSGSFVMAILWWLSLRFNRPVLKKIGLRLAIVFLWFSMFGAWQAEHLKLRIKGYIEDMGGGVVRDSDGNELATGLYLIVRLRNAGIPSTADNWDLSLVGPRGERFKGNLERLPERITIRGSDGVSKFGNDQALYEKAIAQPIPQGGQIAGLLAFSFPGLRPEDVGWAIKAKKLKLTFTDIAGNVQECKDVSEFNTRAPALHPGVPGEYLPKPNK